MLTEIVQGREKSHFILIEDNEHVSGDGLMLAIIPELCNRVDEVHYFSFSHFAGDVKKELCNLSHQVIFHDHFTNPLGWNSGNEVDLKNIFQTIRTTNCKIAIVIDDLCGLTKGLNLASVCQMLSQCCAAKNNLNCDQLVALAHTDIHSQHEINNLNYIADTVLTLHDKDTGKGKSTSVCETFHVASTGKVTKIFESFQCLNNKLIKTNIWNESTVEDTEEDEAENDNPASNLTFNLTLNEQEEEARSKLVLPYTNKKHLDVRMEDKPSGDGFIYYEPDDADDFDEEDPDDDLDF